MSDRRDIQYRAPVRNYALHLLHLRRFITSASGEFFNAYSMGISLYQDACHTKNSTDSERMKHASQ